jgi:arylsulfatase
MPRLQRTAMPPLLGKSYRISANAVIPESGAEGVILSYGGRASGFVFYVKGNRLIYQNNPRNDAREVIASDIPVPRGKVVLAFEFAQDSVGKTPPGQGPSGIGRLFVNGQAVGNAKLSQPLGFLWSQSLGIGQEFGSPVSDGLQPPFKFTGTLEQVKVELE